MATLTVTIPNAVVLRIRAAFVARFSYQATLPDGTANPETQDQFVQRMVREWMRTLVIGYERDNAAATAGAQASTDIALT